MLAGVCVLQWAEGFGASWRLNNMVVQELCRAVRFYPIKGNQMEIDMEIRVICG